MGPFVPQEVPLVAGGGGLGAGGAERLMGASEVARVQEAGKGGGEDWPVDLGACIAPQESGCRRAPARGHPAGVCMVDDAATLPSPFEEAHAPPDGSPVVGTNSQASSGPGASTFRLPRSIRAPWGAFHGTQPQLCLHIWTNTHGSCPVPSCRGLPWLSTCSPGAL